MNRADRRRQGRTRSRLARSGGLASAGVLLSAGLFGAYTGNPRVQRAYASPSCTGSAVATDDTTLRAALDDSTVTCIEIQNTIFLQQDLPAVATDRWNGSPRETEGVTVFGNSGDGADTIDGEQFAGFNFDFSNAVSADVTLAFSDLTLTDFGSNRAIGTYMGYQPTRDITVDLTEVTVSDSSSPTYGGAVYANSFGGSVYVNVTDSSFEGNTSVNAGGAMYAYSYDDTAIVVLNSSTFSYNSVTGPKNGGAKGGALSVRTNAPQGHAEAVINAGTAFDQNSATNTSPDLGLGGAVYSTGSVYVNGRADDTVSFSHNTADMGGAIFAKARTGNAISATITEGSFDHNDAVVHGGAVYVTSDDTTDVTVASSTFTHNRVTGPSSSTSGNGGAIYAGPNGHSTVTVEAGAYFGYNEATKYGGAVFVVNALDIAGTPNDPAVFAHNQAYWGGGAYSATGPGDIQGAYFHDNTAGAGGGALYVGGQHLALNDSTFSLNQAATGGALFTTNADIARTSFVDNTAVSDGGAIAAWPGNSLSLENSFLGGNSAVRNGGGIYLQYNQGNVNLAFTTMYDDTSGGGGTEIWAGNLTSTMSAVGSSTSGDIWELSGTLDDTGSVSTSDDTQFDGNLAPGSFDLGPRNGTLPGAVGRTPNPTSPLAVNGNGGFAAATNPLSSVTRDQLGVTRVFPFTVGARQAIVAPSVTSVTPSTGPAAGGTPVTIHGTGFIGATSAAIRGVAVTSFVVVDDTTITGVTPSGSAGPAGVTVTNPAGVNTLPGGFTFTSPTPPSPEPASAPRDVSAVPGTQSATVSWRAPASTGSFPITSYEAVATPGSRSCVAQAPALSCVITGLTPGTTYTVKVRALSGAGWGAASDPSAPFTPSAPETPSIVIAGARSAGEPSLVRVDGTSTGLVGAQVTPYVKLAGQTRYSAGTGVRTVDAQGRFQWQRKTGKKVYVFFLSGDTRSNRVIIPAK